LTTLRLGTREFGVDDRAVMAIVNRTPDSFFDQGAHVDLASAMSAVDLAVDQGAAIIDVGG
jgi:dihydropteroate synthase